MVIVPFNAQLFQKMDLIILPKNMERLLAHIAANVKFKFNGFAKSPDAALRRILRPAAYAKYASVFRLCAAYLRIFFTKPSILLWPIVRLIKGSLNLWLSDFGNLKALQFYGHGALEKFNGDDEKLPFEVSTDHEPFNALEGSVDNLRPFTDLGILELLDFNLRMDDPLNGFDLIIRNGNGFMTIGFTQDAHDAKSLENFQLGLISEVHQFHEAIAGKHGNKDLLPPVFPLAPDFYFGQKYVY